MSNRLPTIGQLNGMGNDAGLIMSLHIEELEIEINGIMSGGIDPWGGTTKASALSAANKRLKRAHATADAIGMK